MDYLPNFIGFDTFEGMPENSENTREYASGNFETSLERVKQNLQEHIPPQRLKLIAGDFNSLEGNETPLAAPIAIVNIDSPCKIGA